MISDSQSVMSQVVLQVIYRGLVSVIIVARGYHYGYYTLVRIYWLVIYKMKSIFLPGCLSVDIHERFYVNLIVEIFQTIANVLTYYHRYYCGPLKKAHRLGIATFYYSNISNFLLIYNLQLLCR